MRSVQPIGARGSLKWLQRAVAEGWTDLTAPLASRIGGGQAIEWLSPIASDDYAEYRDGAFLERLGLSHLKSALASFWPSGGPQWDGLARTDAGKVLLVEAKAHIGEFYSPNSQASESSLARIHGALESTAAALGVAPARRLDWTRHFYQYGNRLAHLNWLRGQGVNAWLVLIGFVHDDDMPGTTTVEAWQAAYLLADKVLGLPARHSMSRYVLHVHPDVSGR